ILKSRLSYAIHMMLKEIYENRHKGFVGHIRKKPGFYRAIFSISLYITEEVYEDDLYGLLIGLTLKPLEAWKKQEGGAKFKTDDKSERIERLFAPNPILNPAK
ncbi:MAG: hypothetical protein WAM14_03570, partial [Candidatus Nitrosopolaris sp.]